MKTAQALVDAGADVVVSPADGTTPLVIAAINGQFDLASYLLARRRQCQRRERVGDDGALRGSQRRMGAADVLSPAPRPAAAAALVLDFMKALLDKGADPNVRVRRKIWYSITLDLLRIDEAARRRSGGPPTAATWRR